MASAASCGSLALLLPLLLVLCGLSAAVANLPARCRGACAGLELIDAAVRTEAKGANAAHRAAEFRWNRLPGYSGQQSRCDLAELTGAWSRCWQDDTDIVMSASINNCTHSRSFPEPSSSASRERENDHSADSHGNCAHVSEALLMLTSRICTAIHLTMSLSF